MIDEPLIGSEERTEDVMGATLTKCALDLRKIVQSHDAI